MEKGILRPMPLLVGLIAVVAVSWEIARLLVFERPTLVLMGAAATALGMCQPVVRYLLIEGAARKIALMSHAALLWI
jgi:hypothetical protein